MLDWIKVRIRLDTPPRIDGGRVIVMKPGGEVEWQKPRALQLTGSHDGKLTISCCAFTDELVIDGNPVKYFQGHNAFGSSDFRGLVQAVFSHVTERLALPVTEADIGRVSAGLYEVLHVDVTHMYACGSLPRAKAAQAGIERLAHFRNSRYGRGVMHQGTLYFDKHSRRRALKIYPKGEEMKRPDRRVPEGVEHRELVHAWADDKLRIEAVIRRMELKTRGLSRGSAWCDTTADELHADFMQRLEIPMNLELPSDTLDALPGRLRLVYQAWKRGEDVRLLCSRRSFYRYRNELKAHGVDIAAPQPGEVASNVVPFIHRIDLVPSSVPEFALGTSLYFEPRRIA